jgi:putative Holliday junction resolvase
MDGTAGTRAAKTRAFVEWLKSSLNLPVELWDERLTTKEAFRILREQKAGPKGRKARKDQISAVIILSSYLESLR